MKPDELCWAQGSVLLLTYAAFQLSSLLYTMSLKTALGPAASRTMSGLIPWLCPTDLSLFLSCPGLTAKLNFSIHL